MCKMTSSVLFAVRVTTCTCILNSLVYVTNTGEYYNVIGTLKSCLEINATHCVCVKKPPCSFHTQRNALRINATQGNIRNADSEFMYWDLH